MLITWGRCYILVEPDKNHNKQLLNSTVLYGRCNKLSELKKILFHTKNHHKLSVIKNYPKP